MSANAWQYFLSCGSWPDEDGTLIVHPNPKFRWDNIEDMRIFAQEIGFGLLFGATPDGPRVAHVPFVFLTDREIGFHTARSNEITKALDGSKALFVVNGANGYISPDWYGIDDQVPTWNYIAVELQARVRQMDRAELIAQADSLSHFQEARLAPKPVWDRAKMAEGLFDKMLSGIVGFVMEISEWRGTMKLGQNKPEMVRLSAAEGAAAAGNHAIANAMRSLPQ